MVLLLIPLFLQDTVRLDAGVAMARAMARAPAIVAADARFRAVTLAGRDAGRLRNPQLGVSAENLGMQRQVTGKDGLAGTEGQITLQTVLPLGGDLAAARRGATAHTALAANDAAMVRAELQGALLRAIVAHQQQHRVLVAATAESEALDRFAAAMTARALEGRASGGEAARVRTEAVLVASQLTRRHAELAVADAWLATTLDFPANTPFRIDPPAQCEAPGTGAVIDLQRAQAKATLAEALVGQAHARRIPDLIPQVGFRRTAGFSGVLVGVAMDLPLFSSGGNGAAAARADAEAAAADVGQAERDLAAGQAAEQRVFSALQAIGGRYGTDWERDLTQAVTAAEARWQEGQGTLAELFDARRVRLLAIEEHASWRERLLANRVLLARTRGVPITASLLLDDCPGVPR